MSLPTGSGVVSLSDSSSLIVMYGAEQPVSELDSNWSKALATAGWVATVGDKLPKEGKPITRNFTRETAAMTYILTPATRKSPAVSVVLATAQ